MTFAYAEIFLLINHVRRFLILIFFFFICLSGYYFYTNSSTASMPLEIMLAPSKADIEIENFKIIHENEGRKEWELKAKLAQVNL